MSSGPRAAAREPMRRSRCSDMRRTMRRYFIPHAENGYHPHLLHTKRIIFYSILGCAMKGVVVLAAIAVPLRAYMSPDILAEQRAEVVRLTNALRTEPLAVDARLDRSATRKASDMAVGRYFAHVGPNGEQLRTYLRDAKYPFRVAGENLAMGFASARDAVAMWRESPTHRANLLDPEFEDIGVAVVPGEFNSIPTVYITQHFGSEFEDGPPPAASVSSAASHTRAAQAPRGVLGVDTRADGTVRSAVVSWEDLGRRGVALRVEANVAGDRMRVEAIVQNQHIPLIPERPGSDQYIGSLAIPTSAREFFRVVTVPVVEVTGGEGSVVRATATWDVVPLVHPTRMDRYLRSKTAPFFAELFAVERNLFLALLAVFGIAFILNIVIEFRKQHPHVILQSGALVVLLATLVLA